MKYKKFRNLKVNVFDIKFKNFEIDKVLNYMPAGNDVIEILTKDNKNYFIKIERSKVADFESEYTNITKLRKMNYTKTPNIIEFINNNKMKCLVLDEIKGNRLTSLITDKNKNNYIYRLGKELAVIHSINTSNFSNAMQRVINDIPYDGLYGNIDDKINKYIKYLRDNNYNKKMNTFIHGDFHYANILWFNRNISGVLDWEYSGVGHKEQDIAWALIPRSNQKYLNTIEDIQIFLKGYKSIGKYDLKKLKWCFVNGTLHFYLMNSDSSYKTLLLKLIDEVMKMEI